MITTLALALALIDPSIATLEPHSDHMAKQTQKQAQFATMKDLIERYSVDRAAVNSFYHAGFSDRHFQRLGAFVMQWQEALTQMPWEKLDRPGKVDWLLIDNELQHDAWQLAHEQRRLKEVADLLPFASQIVAWEENRWSVSDIDPEPVARELEAMAVSVRDTQSRVEAGLDTANKAKKGVKPLVTSQVQAYRATKYLQELRETLTQWHKHYDGYKPTFSWWTKQPFENLSKSLEEYASFLKSKVAKITDDKTEPLIGDPIGKDALAEDLRHEMIPYSPDELIQIAESEFAWCEKEMALAAKDLKKKDWREALEFVKTLHVKPGKQDELVAQQARDAIKFVENKDLVTVEPLCRETWRVDMLDEKGQSVLPFAAYGGQKMLVSHPLPSMDHTTKLMSLRGNNTHFTRIVTPHELIPGHHLQGYMAQRYNTHRRPFSTAFYGEGWCLHWEMLLWDLAYARNAEDRIGMLFWRMHRCARIIISLKFHLGQMTPDEMITFLVDRVGHEKFTATSEVRRYVGDGYGPLYQCAYMIGGLQIRKLYHDLVATKKMTPKQFHDAVLRSNSIPIEMVRLLLTDEPVNRPFTPKWRFVALPKPSARKN